MSQGSTLEPAVPGYTLLRPIGRGGAGTVYEAQAADDLGRRFAIKIFPPARRAEYARELTTLRAIEAARAAAGSQDLVETIAAAEDDALAYVVMAYASGGDLQGQVRERGPIPVEEAVAYLLPVLRGLELLHAEGLVHKDVKPANVLLGDDGAARLGDFGLTRSLDGAPLSSAGTPGFCAPEVVRGRVEEADHRIDVYSAAATLYFLLTGEAPLPGRPDLFLLERRRVDRALQGVLFRALADDPAQRHASAGALREDLEAWQRGELRLPRARRSVPLAGAALLVAVLLAGAALRSRPERTGSAALPPASSGAVHTGSAAAAPTSPTPAPLPRWDGHELTQTGAAASWDGGDWRGAHGELTLSVFPAAPLARARSFSGTWVAGATAAGETALIASGNVVTRIPGFDLPGFPSLHLSETRCARVMAWGEPERADLLQVFRLRDGALEADLSIPVATCVALLERGGDPPRAALGTPDGRLLVLDLETGQPLSSLRTHRDEVLALTVDPRRDWLFVLGDDREVDALQPELTLKAFPIAALLEGHQRPLLQLPGE